MGYTGRPDLDDHSCTAGVADSELRAMMDKVRVYEYVQRRPLVVGWEPTFKDQHHIAFLQSCVAEAPIPPVSELWLQHMVQVSILVPKQPNSTSEQSGAFPSAAYFPEDLRGLAVERRLHDFRI